MAWRADEDKFDSQSHAEIRRPGRQGRTQIALLGAIGHIVFEINEIGSRPTGRRLFVLAGGGHPEGEEKRRNWGDFSRPK